METLPKEWQELLPKEEQALTPLARVQEARNAGKTVYPPEGMLFTALRLTPPAKVRVVILGQDPYHEPGQAFGLAFAVPPGTPQPPSLRNILKEYTGDLGLTTPQDPDLTIWAKRGVLLLNTLLSVEDATPLAHQNFGWQHFTDAILGACNALRHRVVFILWGKPAQQKRCLIDETRHAVIVAPHPSPLSAYRGFFGSKPFSTANQLLMQAGESPIDWDLGTENAPTAIS